MKKIILLIMCHVIWFCSFAQIEANLSYSNNGAGNISGPGGNIAYEFTLINRWQTKSQIGYKNLHRFNNFVDGNINNQIYELHQTISYQVVSKKKYRFVPNIGLNFRFSHYEAILNPPYNTLPTRALVIGLRKGYLIVSSDNNYRDTHDQANLGFTIQLQNQFYLDKKIWLLITPFAEDDYDGGGIVGGIYAGVKYQFK